MSQTSNFAQVTIAKNDKKISVVFSNSKTYPHAGNTLPLLLNKGDKSGARKVMVKKQNFLTMALIISFLVF